MTRLDAHRPPGNLSLRPLLHHISHLVLGAFLCIQLYFYAKPTLRVWGQRATFWFRLTTALVKVSVAPGKPQVLVLVMKR